MISKMLLKWLSTVAAIVGIVFSIVIISFLGLDFLNGNSDAKIEILSIKPPESIQNTVLIKQPRSELPVRLKIPSINVDAVVEYKGVKSDGTMDVTKGPSNVAWYNLGPRPGEVGSAVISGHFGWEDGISAVFDNLSRLKKGDKIYVIDERGANTAFTVSESRDYDYKANASDVFNSEDGKSHLNLITCKGIWSEAEKSYSKRLVVFADKE